MAGPLVYKRKFFLCVFLEKPSQALPLGGGLLSPRPKSCKHQFLDSFEGCVENKLTSQYGLNYGKKTKHKLYMVLEKGIHTYTHIHSIEIRIKYNQWWLFLGCQNVSIPILLVNSFTIFQFFFFFGSFQGHTCGIWKFPGQGSNLSCSCQLRPQPQPEPLPLPQPHGSKLCL